MLDPLQNILDCMDVIMRCRAALRSNPPNPLYHFMGEMDHIEEIYRQLKEIGIEWD